MVAQCSLHPRPLVMSLRQQREIYLAKFVLLVANTISLVPNLTSLGVGLIFLTLQQYLKELVPYTVQLFGTPLVSMGFLAYGAANLGFCCLWRHGRVMLIVYSMCTICLIMTQVYLMAATKDWRQEGYVKNVSETWLSEKFADDNTRPAFTPIEFFIGCCGSHGAQSYVALGEVVPAACCKYGTDADYRCAGNATRRGCAVTIPEQLEFDAHLARHVFFYAVALEIIGLLACVVLYRNVPKKVYEPMYSIVVNNQTAQEENIEMEDVVIFPPQREPRSKEE